MKLKISVEREFTDEMVDQVVDHYDKKGNPISCGKGCSFCCHQHVACLPEEVEILFLKHSDSINIHKLESQVRDWGNSEKSCVFLKNGECSVYEDRPMMCRRMIVNSPSENCDTSKGKKNITKVLIAPLENRLKRNFQTHGKVLLHQALYNRLTD